MEAQQLRIEGFPAADGAYWYYKMGQEMPSLVWIGTYKGGRAIKDGSAIQRYWLPGEFFVGPILPPFATPHDLALPSEDDWVRALDNAQHPTQMAASQRKQDALQGF